MYKPDYLLDDEELKALARQMEDMGRFGDSKLVHVNEKELRVLKNMGAGTRNPDTGLLEFYDEDDFADESGSTEGFGDGGAGDQATESISRDATGEDRAEQDTEDSEEQEEESIFSSIGNAIKSSFDLDKDGEIGPGEVIAGVALPGIGLFNAIGDALGDSSGSQNNSDGNGDSGRDSDSEDNYKISSENDVSDVLGDLRIDTSFEQLKIAPSGYAETSMVGGAAVRNPGFRKYDYSTGVASSERTAPVTGINARDMISSGAMLNQDAYNVAQRATNSISSLIAETGQDFKGEIDVAYDRQGNLKIKLGNLTSPSYENSEKGFASMMGDVSKAISYGVSNEDFTIDESFARRSQLFYKYQNTATEDLQGLFDEITTSADVALAIGDVASYNSATSELQDLQDELNRRASA